MPIITNYEHYITGGSEQNWSITQDTRGVMYFGNQDKGVLEYDGVTWRSIPITNNSAVRSLVIGDDNVVYVGAVEEFGYLVPDCYGNMYYKSLINRIPVPDTVYTGFSDVWKTYYSRDTVYFCSRSYIFKYAPLADSIQIVTLPKNALFSFNLGADIYTCSYGEGIMKLNYDHFITIPGGDFFREKNVSGMCEIDSSKILVATFFQGLFTLDRKTGEVDDRFVSEGVNNYLKSGQVVYLQDLNQAFMIADLYNGITIIGRNGQALEIITEAEGLHDQQVPYVYSNKLLKDSAPVWIANFQGISKIETNNPFRVFTEKSGFDGFISDIKYFNQRLYISTSTGLYYKNSTSTSTEFINIPDIQDQIWKMHHFVPDNGKDYLLAITNSIDLYLIDHNHNVQRMTDLVVNRSNTESEFPYSGFTISGDPADPNALFIGSSSEIYRLRYSGGKWTETLVLNKLPQEIRSVIVDKYHLLWAGTINGGVIRYDLKRERDVDNPVIFTNGNGLPANQKNHVFLDPESDGVLFGTMDGFYTYDYTKDTIIRDSVLNRLLPEGPNSMLAFHEDYEDDIWISFENERMGWTEMVLHRTQQDYSVIYDRTFQRLPNASADVFYSNPANGFWFAKSNELYHYDKSFVRNDTLPFHTLIRNVYINNDSLLFNGTCFIDDGKGGFTIYPVQAEDTQPFIKYRYNNIEFRWAAPFFEQEDRMVYSFWLEPFNDDWSEWTSAVYKDFTNLPHGSYTMHVKAMNVYGDISLPAHYSFTILRPWYSSILAFIAYVILAALTVYFIIKLYTRRLKQENIRLEGIIQERTAEIRRQKEELTDSIEYASRIQRALLPSNKLLVEKEIGHFILFRPRDIVSGDFYWMGQKEDKIYVVAADCTGHGVPGAFMSMLGISFLDEIIIKSNISDTNLILDALRNHVITSLKQTGKSMEESTRDGMDLAMIAYDQKSQKIQFSGAYNPLYYVRKLNREEKALISRGDELDLPKGAMNNDTHILFQIKGDQMPIGISEKVFEFSATELENEGYSLYLFTDGYVDQFGGTGGKKFMSRNFKQSILEAQKYPIEKQGPLMNEILNDWMGNISQIDDILVIGLQLN
ncbi:MAG: SpoIIE family protein phosphatase [Bacteroidales bacterium]|nr:SpoIIE family protein phosphatase [Bacteroidales bacterium]